ncbi:P-loop containing nucleoside triphosphate hydrolase protein [Gonapodya prolifera JEL478]|uniref:p-loop containing nucleoside triphosphate hydrolase protein n=1 Tax=Gonapodya prolifera (strain JEL478) TaxID=1344416 RepID=A0A139ALU0_GONPJ|nr:P-loop containing nucleoside triphosphate hydrolase protein [Gonapodya prolifera JEL478]|eukprot:KXS17752.1 P-loop containing nucleoside triphosphate hydrolase protein [Gonapodya prolifera JEL478]
MDSATPLLKSYELAVPDAPGADPSATLRWDALGYAIKGKKLIEGISGAVSAGELLGILGGSGSGKTTLLNTLSGRLSGGDIAGQVLFNDDLRNPATWPREYGFVEQGDEFHMNLTVGETVDYTTTLKVRGSAAKKAERANEVLQQLGLLPSRDTLVRNISTGERKRLSVALELLSSPRVLFCDEITTGLDSFTALQTMEYMRSITARSRTISIVTIHQPRENILGLFDKIIVLSCGRVVFFGAASDATMYFAKRGFEMKGSLMNPSDYWLDISTPDYRTPAQLEESRARIANLQKEWTSAAGAGVKAASDDDGTLRVEYAPTGPHESTYSHSLFVEFAELVKLNWRLVVRNTSLHIARVAVLVVTCLLLSLAFWRIEKSTLDGVLSFLGFLISYETACVYSFLADPVVVFLENRKVFKRERAARMYRSSTLFVAASAVYAPYYAFFAAIELVIFYGTVSFDNLGITMLSQVVLCILFTNVGLALGAVAPNHVICRSLTAVLTIACQIFCGYFASVNKLLPWIKAIVPSQYALCMWGQAAFSEFPPKISLETTSASVNPDMCILPDFWKNMAIQCGFVGASIILGVVFVHFGTTGTKHKLS